MLILHHTGPLTGVHFRPEEWNPNIDIKDIAATTFAAVAKLERKQRSLHLCNTLSSRGPCSGQHHALQTQMMHFLCTILIFFTPGICVKRPKLIPHDVFSLMITAFPASRLYITVIFRRVYMFMPLSDPERHSGEAAHWQQRAADFLRTSPVQLSALKSPRGQS